jgi:hypothetical protein
MRTAAAVDDVILWLVAAILVLLWTGVAGVGAYKTRAASNLTASPASCAAAVDVACRRSPQL